MSTATRNKLTPQSPEYGDPSFDRIEVTDEFITAYLSDGRTVAVPMPVSIGD